MSDVFISYSRKDSEQALALAEKLRAEGMSVWIDQQGIEAATSWSQEIVEEIDSCKVFLLLLSQHAIPSNNVIKEVTIAYESERTILPVELEQVKATPAFRYQLAGIQRVSVTNLDAIVRSLRKHGAGESGPAFRAAHTHERTHGTRHPEPGTRPHDTDLRKSLMVLPFEDLSPEKDNAWFADGLTSELITSLSNVKTLRLIDRRTSMDYKGFRGSTTEIAHDLNVRYFLEGAVRKFGDEIKISLELLDIEEGKHFWTDAHRGKFADIFDIQEEVAAKVVNGLRLKLTPDEAKHVFQRDTESAQAYELSLKANEYFLRQTEEGFRHAARMWGDAIAIDSNYAYAYQSKANALAALYSDYDRKREYLDEAESLIGEALRLRPDLYIAYHPLSHIYQLQGKLKEAEETAQEFIRKAPEHYLSHFALGYFYMQTGQSAKAIEPYAKAIRLRPDDMTGYINLVIVCDNANEKEKAAYWSREALPSIERHIRLHPDDEGTFVQYVLLLIHAGKVEEARALIPRLGQVRDGSSLYNAACVLLALGEHREGLKAFCKSIEAGFRHMTLLNEWLDEDLASHVDLEEFEEAKRLVASL